MEEKHPCRTSCVLSESRLNSRPQLILQFNSNILVNNYFFPKNYVTSEEAVSHNVLYYQQLSIARLYQVIFCMVTISLSDYQKVSSA